MAVSPDTGAATTKKGSFWNKLRTATRLVSAWKLETKRTVAAATATKIHRHRQTNHTLYYSGMMKLWANRRGKTAAITPNMAKTKAHYRQLFQMLDINGCGRIHAAEFASAALASGIELTRKQAAGMIASVDENHDESIDFNEFQNLIDRDITTLTNEELSNGPPLRFFMIAWQRRTMMARVMETLTLSPGDVYLMKQRRRLAAEARDRLKSEEADLYWREQAVRGTRDDYDDGAALESIVGAENHAFRLLHERLCLHSTSRRLQGGRGRISLLEVQEKLKTSRKISEALGERAHGAATEPFV